MYVHLRNVDISVSYLMPNKLDGLTLKLELGKDARSIIHTYATTPNLSFKVKTVTQAKPS